MTSQTNDASETPWIEVVCGKCEIHLQLPIVPDTRDIVHALPYQDDPFDPYLTADQMLPCPFCNRWQRGTHPLRRVGSRPPRGWELYEHSLDILVGHVPGEGWVTFPCKPGGYELRVPDVRGEFTFIGQTSRAAPITLDEDLDAYGSTGWPPFAEEWERMVERCQENEEAWAEELAEHRARQRGVD